MSKFGEITASPLPVLIDFFDDGNESSVDMSSLVKEIAAEFADSIKVMKIDVNKNEELTDALRIKSTPTLMIYVGGVMAWKHSGEIEKEDIVEILKEQVKWHNSLS